MEKIIESEEVEEFTEYDFFCLLLATKRNNNHPVYMNLTEIERDLFPYHEMEKYKDLFEDVLACKRLDDERVLLGKAYNKAKTNGLVSSINGSRESIINCISSQEAQLLIDEDKDKSELMDEIVKEMGLKNPSRIYVMHPIKHNEENNK